jgi:hypothetical protein
MSLGYLLDCLHEALVAFAVHGTLIFGPTMGMK